MNPRTILWQAAATLVVLAAIDALASPSLTIWLAGIAVFCWLALDAGYAHALGVQGRSKRRIKGDHRVAAYLGAGVGLALILGVVSVTVGVRPGLTAWGFDHGEVEALLGAGGALMVAVLISSMIDWYYIRPRIDGVVWPPPCLAKADEKARWKRVTRRWYIHRGLATLAYMAFALAVAIVVVLMLAREDRFAAAVIGGVSGIASLLLIFVGSYRSELPVVAKWALSPAFCLGDDIEFEGIRKAKRGYVLHVAVPVVKLVPLDEHGRRTDRPYIEPKNTQLAEAEVEAKPAVACAHGCAGLNPECVRRRTAGNRRLDRRRHRLIF